ncbi:MULTISPECIES: hypothetical protein [Streptomyces]|uniref:hypothetical protein n=1 Tax=Streptomyces TaxID=1883 RepID=UPI0033EB4BDF
MEALLLIRERTRDDWLRWDIFGPNQAGALREEGLFDSEQHRLGRWAYRTVWVRRAALRIWTLGGFDLPRPLSVGRTALFTATAFSALGPDLPAASGHRSSLGRRRLGSCGRRTTRDRKAPHPKALGAGLRHAREALGGAHDDEARTARNGESDE